MRRWLLAVVLLAVFTSTLPPDGDQRVDRLATIIVISTLAMGAITVRRPVGLRVMLGVFAALAFAYMCTTLDAFQPS